METNFVRDWVCSCGCSFTAPVVISGMTTHNLSGEATAWCPNCHKKPLCGGTPYDKDTGELLIGDKRLGQLDENPLEMGALSSVVASALRQTIEAHGPITKGWTGSAAKRVAGGLIGLFKDKARTELAKASAKTLVLREDDEEFQRVKTQNTRLRKVVHDLLEKCREAGIIPKKVSHDDRDKKV